MAKKEDEVDLGDFDLDNFDFDIPSYDTEEPAENSRTPVLKTGKAILKGAKDNLATPSSLRKFMSMALPEGYGLALDTVDSTWDDAKELYDKVAQSAPDTLRKGKTLTRKLLDKTNQKMPTKLGQALRNLIGDEDSDDYQPKTEQQLRDEEDNRQLEELNALFKTRMKVDQVQAKQANAERTEDRLLENQRFQSTAQLLSSINMRAGRLVAYQDKVQIRFQQKSLELMYRQFATMKQLLDISTVNQEKMISTLAEVRHNTALPEAVKIQKSELFGLMAKERLFGGALNTVSRWGNNYRKQLTDNVKNLLDGALRGLEAGKDAVAMTEGLDKATIYGGAIGGELGGWLRDRAAMAIAPYLEQREGVRFVGEKLKRRFTGIPQKLNEWAQSDTTETGWKGGMMDFLKVLMPRFSLNNRIGGEAVDTLDQPALFDKATRRSIIEIIPGYLEHIAYWTRAAVKGDDGQRLTWNPTRGGFTSKKDNNLDIGRQIVNFSEREAMRDQVDRFIDKVGGERLTPAAREVLRRKVVNEVANGLDMSPQRLADPSSYTNATPEVAEEIADVMRDHFGLTWDGKIQENNSDDLKRFNETRDQYLRLANMIPAAGDRIRILGDVLGKDNLRNMGLIERVGMEDRINYDRVFDMVFSDGKDVSNPADQGSAPSGAPTPAADRNRAGAGDVAPAPAGADVRPVAGPIPAQQQAVVVDQLDKYFGERSLLITTLLSSQEIHRETLAQIEQISAGLSDLGGAADRLAAGGGRPRLGQRLLDTLRTGVGAAGKLGGGYFKAWGEIYKGGFGLAKEITKGGFGVLQAAAGWRPKSQSGSGESAETMPQDVYAGGNHNPLLTAWKMLNNEYRDALTNKPIKTLKDITGPVKDATGKIVLTMEDIKQGLHNQEGQPILVTLAKKLWKTVGAIGGGYLSLASVPFLAAKKFGDALKDRLGLLEDLFVPGESTVRIEARKLEQRQYYDSVAKKWIGRIDEMKGDLLDADGKLVLSYREFQEKGLISRSGRWIKAATLHGQRLMNTAFDTISALVKAPYRIARMAYRKVRSGFRFLRRSLRRLLLGAAPAHIDVSKELTGDVGSDLVTVGLWQFEMQQNIHNLLAQGMTKGVRFDSSGDGLRDGSWQERLRQKLSRKAEETAAKKDDKEAAFGGGLLSGLKKLFDRKKDDDEDSGDTSIDIETGDKDSKSRRRRGRKPKGKAGWFKTALKKTGKAAWWVTKNLGKAAWWAVTSASGLAIRSIFAVGAGLLSAPVLATGALVGGAALIGYKAYKRIKAKFPPMMRLRFAQYGYEPLRTTTGIEKIMELEQMFLANATVNAEGTVSINERTVNFEKIMSLFGVPNDPEHSEFKDRYSRAVKYTVQRFKTVFAVHLSALYRLTKTQDLTTVDEKLKGQVAVDFVKAVEMADHAKLFDQLDGPNWDEDLTEDADDVEDWYKDVLEEVTEAAKQSPVTDAKITQSKLPPATTTPAAATTAAAAAGGAAAAVAGNPSKGPLGGSESKAAFALVVPGVAPVVGAKLLVSSKPKEAVGADADKLDFAKPVRYRVYGLTELTLTKVRQLAELEAATWPRVRYDNKGRAFVDKQDELYRQFIEMFALTSGDQRAAYTWFHKRYLPTILEYCSAVRAEATIDAKDAARRLNPVQLLKVLQLTAAATYTEAGDWAPVWSISDSPWPGYTLNADPASVDPNLNALAERANDTKVSESGFVDSVRNFFKSKFGQTKKDADQTTQDRYAKVPETASPTAKAIMEGPKSPGGLMDWFKSFGSDKTVPQQGGAVGGAGAAQGSLVMDTTGAAIQHPGGGSGGDINQVPMPKGDGWPNVRDTILAAAKMVGFDPGIAASVAGIESGYRAFAKAGTSSATGFYQMIRGTWNAQMKKYGAMFGINPNTPPTDPRANALLGIAYLKDNYDYLKKSIKRPLTDTDLYIAHFLGPGGARQFLSADPATPAYMAVQPAQARANRSIFFSGGTPLTVAQVYNNFSKKLNAHRQSDATMAAAGQAMAQEKAGETPPPDNTAAADAGLVEQYKQTGGASALAPNATPVAPNSPLPSPAAGAPAVASLVQPSGNIPTGPSGAAAPAATSAAGPELPPVSPAAQAVKLQADLAEVQTAKQREATAASMEGVGGTLSEMLKVQQSADGHLASILTTLELIAESIQQSSAPANPAATQARTPTSKRSEPAPNPVVSVKR